MSARNRLLAIVLALVTVAGCQQAEPPERVTIILGFDGMDPVLVQRWMDEGRLPNLARLRAEGLFQPLATSNPPQSPVAWSSFATGEAPGRHGIYDFLRRDPQTHTAAYAISRTEPPRTLDLFGLSLPISSGELINRRLGEPFWSSAERQGQRTSTLRVPVTYPPDDTHRMLSGMGVPDLLGTQGTYSVFSTAPRLAAGGNGRVVRLRPGRDGSVDVAFEGPPHPLDGESRLSVPLTARPDGDGVEFELDGESVRLSPGQWSRWIRVEFRFLGVLKVSGIVRLHLNSIVPNLEFYVSPIQIDPADPVVPLSSPAGYATDLAQRIGDYHTIGMPEETWSLTEGDLTDDAWLDMVRTTLAEREAMFYDTLDRRDSDIVTAVFVQTDRVSHLFYRGLDPLHPLHDPDDRTAAEAIAWIYGEADRIVGETRARMRDGDRLVIISDHGFAPFRKAVHINRGLAILGFLKLKDGSATSGDGLEAVDWSKTSAYALGLNGIWLNLAGREAMGSVEPDQAQQLLNRVRDGLLTLTDPESGEPLVRRVFLGQEIYPENRNGDAPDLVVGYHSGYRASWQTTLGGVPADLVAPNRSKWSGDHCIDPQLVPGVLFMSDAPKQPPATIQEVGRWVLEHPP